MEARVSAGFTFGGLEQSVDCFDEAVGLACLGPSDDAIEMLADHGGDVLHGIDLGAHDVGAPLSEHCGYDVDLLAVEDVAQLFAIEPCARGALGGELRDQLVEVGRLVAGELAAVLEQRPTQPFERGIGPLLPAPHLVYSLAGVSDDMELVEGDPGVGQLVGDAFDEGRRHVDADRSDVFRVGVVGAQMLRKSRDGVGISPFGDEHDPAGVGVC